MTESDGKEALWGDIREIRLEQVGQESGKGFTMEGIDLTFGLGRKYAIVGRAEAGNPASSGCPPNMGRTIQAVSWSTGGSFRGTSIL